MTIDLRPTTAPAVSVPAEKTVADVLRHAALIIEERGWVQGHFGDPGGPVCMVGAMNVANGLDPDSKCFAGPADDFLNVNRDIDAPTFNDEEGRTASEVTAALRAAADAWEADR